MWQNEGVSKIGFTQYFSNLSGRNRNVSKKWSSLGIAPLLERMVVFLKNNVIPIHEGSRYCRTIGKLQITHLFAKLS